MTPRARPLPSSWRGPAQLGQISSSPLVTAVSTGPGGSCWPAETPRSGDVEARGCLRRQGYPAPRAAWDGASGRVAAAGVRCSRDRLWRHRHESVVRVRESFEHAGLEVSRANAFGVASVVFWALIVIISIKYLLLVMRADNHGEGGILALTALLMPTRGLPVGTKRVIIALGVRHGVAVWGRAHHARHLGAQRRRGIRGGNDGFRVVGDSGLGGDPDRSVRGGKRGTEKMLTVFGPVMVGVVRRPRCAGLSPDHRQPRCASSRLAHLRRRALRQRSGRSLPCTGFDLPGRDGRRGPVRRHGPLRSSTNRRFSWYALVLPALLLNYFGQAALLADSPVMRWAIRSSGWRRRGPLRHWRCWRRWPP